MPEKMSLHIRGDLGGTIIKKGDKMEILHTKTEETQGNFVYPYWHPSGDYIVYSVIRPSVPSCRQGSSCGSH